MKNNIFFFVCIIFTQVLFGQNVEYFQLIKEADSLYQAKDYKTSAITYSAAFRNNNLIERVDDHYNAACSWAMANNIDSSFFQLDRIIKKDNYVNYRHIINDSDLILLHKDNRWEPLLELIKQNKTKADANLNKPLVAELNSIFEYDQKYRAQLDEIEKKYGSESNEIKALGKIIKYNDSLNLAKVTSLLDLYGWLGADVVGGQGNTALFLVIQHSDLRIQEKYLPMMRQAVKHGRATGSSLALLEDRVALGQGKKQIYGSQIGRHYDTKLYYVRPLIDPDNVDKRRSQVGLQPLAKYLTQWQIKWDVEQYKKNLLVSESNL